jgi:hypothetical protein
MRKVLPWLGQWVSCAMAGLGTLALFMGTVHAQCSVSLGADTSICAPSHTLVPGLSIAVFEDSLEITYDATQGQTGLVGASKVYMHSAAEMVPFGGWQYITGNWGQDDGIGEMTAVGTDLWRIRIDPQNYYGYPASAAPNGIFMVFRNADGSATGKDPTGNDIWMDMTQDPPVPAFGGVEGTWVRDALDSLWWSDGSSGSTLTVHSPGTYWITITDTAGCSASDSLTVTFGTIPLVDLGQPMLCDGQPVTLDAGTGYVRYAWSTGDTTRTTVVSGVGFYTVTVTNAAGCQGSDVVYVPVGLTPTADFQAIVTGLTVQLIDWSGAWGGDYAWDFDNDGSVNSTLQGSTSYTYPAAGIYVISLIINNYCGADTILDTVTVGNVVGMDEVFEGGFALSPNPAREYVVIQAHLPKPSHLQVRIMDAQGHLWRQELPGRVAGFFRKEIDVQGWPAGMYMIVFLQDGRCWTRSFAKL